MIYIVIPIELKEVSDKDFHVSLANKTESIFGLYAPSFYVVKFRGTSRELARAVGIGEHESGDTGDNSKAHTGLVVPFTRYFGYASMSLWEWTEAHGEG